MDGVIEELLAVDPAALGHEARLDHLLALEQLTARVAALTQYTLAAIENDPPCLPGQLEPCSRQWGREEVACLLRLSPGWAGVRLIEAAAMLDRLPRTLDAVEMGQFSLAHARVLHEATRDLDPAIAAAVEAVVLPKAPEETVAEFRRLVKRAVLRLDPRGQEQKTAMAVAGRRVWTRPLPDSMAFLGAELPAADAATIMAAVQAYADQLATHDRTTGHGNTGDGNTARNAGRSADQLRADALTGLGAAALNGHLVGELPMQQGRRPTVQVTVALSTLLGLDFQPGELLGHGPIPATMALQIAFDPTGTWRRLLTDEHGTLLDYGTTRYRPPMQLRDYVIARDQTCRMPGCNRAACRCHLDHHHDHALGGTTSEANLGALCSRHHACKHTGGWHVTRRTDGVTTWISPLGRHYQKPPDPHPIDRSLHPPPEQSRPSALLTRSERTITRPTQQPALTAARRDLPDDPPF